MTASDVGHTSSSAQLLLDAVQRGDPFLVDVGLVTGSKEPLGPAEKTRVMLSPRQAFSGPKTLGYQRLIMVDGRDGVETSDHCRRTVWIRKHRGLFSRKKKGVLRRDVGDVARSCLGTQPFAKLSLMEVGLFGELLGGRRANLSKRGVESKPVAQNNKRP